MNLLTNQLLPFTLSAAFALPACGGRTSLLSPDQNETVTGAGGAGISPLTGDEIEKISVNSEGLPASTHSQRPCINHDGTLIGFSSWSPVLYNDDMDYTNAGQLFLRNRTDGTTEMLSVNDEGMPGEGISEAFGYSGGCFISGDDQRVSYFTSAVNLGGVTGADSRSHIYVRDLASLKTLLADKNALGEPEGVNDNGAVEETAPLTFDGTSLLYRNGDGTELVFRNLETGARTVLVSDFSDDGYITAPFLAAGDRYAVYDTLVPDEDLVGVFLYDLQNGTNELVGVSSSGTLVKSSRQGSISSDGHYVAFEVFGEGGWDTQVVLRDLERGANIYLGTGRNAEISSSGRYVAFEETDPKEGCGAACVIAVAVYDRETGTTRRIGEGGYGSTLPVRARLPRWSGDERYLVFQSESDKLVTGDNNPHIDVFVVGLKRIFQ